MAIANFESCADLFFSLLFEAGAESVRALIVSLCAPKNMVTLCIGLRLKKRQSYTF